MVESLEYVLTGPTPLAVYVRITPGQSLGVKANKFVGEKVVSLDRIRGLGIGSYMGSPSFSIKYDDDSGQAKTQRIVVDPFDPETVRLCRDLRTVHAKKALWSNDFRDAAKSNASGEMTFPLVVKVNALLRKSYLPRWGVLLLLLSLILTLPLFVYALIAGCFRLTVDAEGLKSKGWLVRKIAWGEIEKVEPQRLTVTNRMYGANVGKQQYLEFTVRSKDQKILFARLAPLAAGVLVREFVDRKLLDAAWLDVMVA